ncbi:MAG: hypothetical protein M3336_10675 [Chloroflexota bacterium]|nr:hypothetical protein [Chloroflexota bacterium]
MQLAGALLDRAQRLLQRSRADSSFSCRRALLDGGFPRALLLLGPLLLAQALLGREQLLLDQALLGLDRLQAPALLGGRALLGQELRTELEDADRGAVPSGGGAPLCCICL